MSIATGNLIDKVSLSQTSDLRPRTDSIIRDLNMRGKSHHLCIEVQQFVMTAVSNIIFPMIRRLNVNDSYLAWHLVVSVVKS